jgi:hypothetical protein
MFNVEFTAEELAKVEAVDAARANREAERSAAAAVAYKKALADVGWDRSRLIVHPMPDGFGGAVIHKIPAFEAWAMLDKRVLKALTSDGKKDDYAAAVAGLIENPALRIHPSLSELQEYRDELPGLYGQVKTTLDARCEHGSYVGKSMTSSAKRDAPPKVSPT